MRFTPEIKIASAVGFKSRGAEPNGGPPVMDSQAVMFWP